MHGTKIVQFLKCLSKDELRDFGKFVKSPFHNNRKEVARYFDILKKYYPDFNIDIKARKNIFKQLYTGKNFDPDFPILLNSYLFNLGKEFLSITELKQDYFSNRYYFLRSLDKHHCNQLFEKEFKSTSDFLHSEKMSDKLFYKKSQLEELKINYNLKRNRQDKVCKDTVDFANLFIQSFIVRLSLTYHDLVADMSAFNYEFRDSSVELFLKNFDFENFIKDLKIEDSSHSDYVRYYYYLFMSYYHQHDISLFPKLKEYSFINFDNLSVEEKSSRFHFLINYCILQIENGNYEFLNESFELYKEAFEKKHHFTNFEDKDIGLMFFRNFVLVGLAAREYSYVEKFMSDYGSQLKGNHVQDLLIISYAMLHFEKKEYDKSLEYLSRMDYSYPSFRLGIKHLYLKIYFEVKDFDTMFFHLDSYKHYLKNDKTLPERTRELHSNFLNYTSRLAKIKSSTEKDGLYVLRKEIKENSNLDFRHKIWLLEKMGS